MAINTYGFDSVAWDVAKQEGKVVLQACARARQMIPYSNFVQRLSAITIEAHDPRLAHFLEEITSEESAAKRGMLTALVVHKTGDFQPGPGFFELARNLGYQFTDIEKFWIQEVKRVFEIWAK